jgi:hypothetical protein
MKGAVSFFRCSAAAWSREAWIGTKKFRLNSALGAEQPRIEELHQRPQTGSEARRFVLPIAHHRSRADQENRRTRRCFALVLDMSQGLDRLAEPREGLPEVIVEFEFQGLASIRISTRRSGAHAVGSSSRGSRLAIRIPED